MKINDTLKLEKCDYFQKNTFLFDVASTSNAKYTQLGINGVNYLFTYIKHSDIITNRCLYENS